MPVTLLWQSLDPLALHTRAKIPTLIRPSLRPFLPVPCLKSTRTRDACSRTRSTKSFSTAELCAHGSVCVRVHVACVTWWGVCAETHTCRAVCACHARAWVACSWGSSSPPNQPTSGRSSGGRGTPCRRRLTVHCTGLAQRCPQSAWGVGCGQAADARQRLGEHTPRHGARTIPRWRSSARSHCLRLVRESCSCLRSSR